MFQHRRTALGAATHLMGDQTSATSANTTSSFTAAAEHLPVYLKPSTSRRRKASFSISRMRESQPPAGAIVAEGLGSATPLFAITSNSCEFFALRLPLLKAGFKRLPLVGGDIATACNVVWGKMPRAPPQGTGPAGSICVPYAPPPSLQGAYSPTPSGGPTLAAFAETNEERPTTTTIPLSSPLQKFNHYPSSHNNLGCKRGMAKNLIQAEKAVLQVAAREGRRQEAATQMFAFSPRTWFYPSDKEALVKMFKSAPPSSNFIWKPARGSCGRGIVLSQGGATNEKSWMGVMREIDEKATLERNGRIYGNYVVQEYLENPLLLEGRKMDLRLYVTVTSYDPLTVYWHEEGLVRLAAEPYYDNSSNLSSGQTAPQLGRAVVPQEDDGATDILGTTQAAPSQRVEDFMAGVAGEDHNPSADLLGGRFRYLTNYSVGRRYTAAKQGRRAVDGVDGDQSQTGGAPATTLRGSPPTYMGDAQSLGGDAAVDPGPELKWSMEKLWNYLDSEHLSHSPSPFSLPSAALPSLVVKERIAQLITRTLLSTRPNLLRGMEKAFTSCTYFELYGFDVMLDEHLNPSLIEINTMPSLESSSDFDYSTKSNVTADLFNLAMIEPFARDPVTLAPFTTRAELLRAPAPSLHQFVRSPGEEGHAVSLAEMSVAEQRTEIAATLHDELMYARGFKRIFPPPPSNINDGDSNNAYPITLGHRSMQEDLENYAAFGMLTPFDKLALSIV